MGCASHGIPRTRARERVSARAHVSVRLLSPYIGDSAYLQKPLRGLVSPGTQPPQRLRRMRAACAGTRQTSKPRPRLRGHTRTRAYSRNLVTQR